MNTSTHDFLPEEVMAFLDGELSPERAAAITTHLETCAACSASAANLRSLSNQIAQWRVEQTPASLDEAATPRELESLSRGRGVVGGVPERRSSPVLKWLVVVGSASAVLLLLMTAGAPRLLRSRMAANEASAVGSLRTLNTAAVTYLDTYGHYPPSLRSFGPPMSGKANEEAADLVDPVLAGGRKSGYSFNYRSYPTLGSTHWGTYTIQADPLDRSSGYRHFSTDQTGVIRADGEVLDGSGSSTAPGRSSGTNKSEPSSNAFTDASPMIARNAELKIEVKNLNEAREGMDKTLALHKGYAARLSASAEGDSARTLAASLRVPVDHLDRCMAELKKLGRVTEESQSGEEVTQQHMDLVARLKNARTTETRLNQVIQQRADKVKDILDVEKESARVRGEIEQMEAEQKNLEHRVDFATIDLKLAEEYKARLSSPAPSVGTQLRNATVNGFRSAFESLVALVLFLAEIGPTLLIWALLLCFPAWLLWRRYRRAQSLGTSLSA